MSDADAEFEIGEDDLIDDLEDNDDGIATLDGRTGSWYTYNDGTASGTQLPAGDVFKPKSGGAKGSKYAAHTSGKGFTEWGAGMALDLNYDGTKEVGKGSPKPTYDASKHEGVTFLAKGKGSLRFQVMVPGAIAEAEGGTCVEGTGDAGQCGNGHGVGLALKADTWQRYAIPFTELAQDEGWGQTVDFDAKKIVSFQFNFALGADFSLDVDDIAFY